jgi:hypothetical protein
LKQFLFVAIVIACLIAGFLAARFMPDLQAVNALPEVETITTVKDCDLSEGPCTHDGFRLEILERPVAPLRQLTAQLTVSEDIRNPLLNLEMIGMDMGINRFRFVEKKPGVWEATIMIPVCSTGRRDWLASLIYGREGVPERLDYQLSVAGM